MQNTAILKSKILGWGVDLNSKDRPGSRREANQETVIDFQKLQREEIPQQVPRVEILVSLEHKKITPVFGTSCPPKGLSGIIRRIAFQLNEGQKGHWILLLAADRIDVFENTLFSLLQGRSHNPLKEMGLRVELRRGGIMSRFGHNRADTLRWAQQFLLASGLIGIGVFLYQSNRILKKYTA